jgi:LEA14-like dessication related protein
MRATFLALVIATTVGCSRPKPVQLTLQSAQLSSISPSGVSVALTLDAHNPNSFPISASAVTASIQLENGSELGHGSSPASFQIPAEGDAALPAQLALQWTNLTLLAPYALSGRPLPYRIVGTAKVGSERLNMELPFSISGQLTREQVLNAGLTGVMKRP